MIQMTAFEVTNDDGVIVKCCKCKREHVIDRRDSPDANMVLQLMNWLNNHSMCGKDRW